jgi:hypothetical protein
MKKRKPVQTSEELIRAFADLFDEIEPETPAEIDAMLREAGYDPDEIGAQMKAVAEQALANSPLNWRNRAPQEMAEEQARFDKAESTSPRNRTDMIKAIQQLLAGRSEQALAHFRNLESASDDDLASMLAELEFLASQEHRDQDEDDQ